MDKIALQFKIIARIISKAIKILPSQETKKESFKTQLKFFAVLKLSVFFVLFKKNMEISARDDGYAHRGHRTHNRDNGWIQESLSRCRSFYNNRQLPP